MSAFANCGRAVAHVRGSYVPTTEVVIVGHALFPSMSIAFGNLATASHFRTAPFVLHSYLIRRCPTLSIPREQRSPVLAAALPRTETEELLVTRDHAVATLAAADLRAAVRNGRELLARLPLRSQRTSVQKAAGEAIVHLTADAAWRFFRRHAVPMYRELTREGARSLRVDALLGRPRRAGLTFCLLKPNSSPRAIACKLTRTASRFTKACSLAKSWPIHRQGIT